MGAVIANPFGSAPPVPLAVAYGTLALWLVAEAAAWGSVRRARAARAPGAVRADAGSFWAVIVALGLGVEVAFACFVTGFGWFLPEGLWPVGFGVALAGVALRVWSIVTLGRFFSPVVQLEADHAIVRAGPYRWLRHPSYTGLLLTLVGIGLTVGTLTGIGFALLIAAGPFGYRIHVEERALAARFGPAWSEYARSTWRLVPGLL